MRLLLLCNQKDKLKICLDYPKEAPLVKFSPPLKHPNVSLDGTVSIPYLDNWRSSSQLKGLISSIYKILKSPLIEESVNLEAVYEYVSQKIQVSWNNIT